MTKTLTPLDRALEWGAAGHYVLPLAPSNKRPLVAYLADGIEHVPTELIREWWARWPTAEVGVIPGRAKPAMLVVDVDWHPGGSDGRESIHAAGIDLDIGAGIASSSGNGEHHWFRAPDGVVPGNRSPLAGVDVRGYNGIVRVTHYDTPVSPSEGIEVAPGWAVSAFGGDPVAAPFGGDVATWLEACEPGPLALSEGVLSILDAVPQVFGHGELLTAQAALVARGALGHVGVPEAIDILRQRFLTPPWDDAAHASEFDTALATAIAKYGAFAYPTHAQAGAGEASFEENMQASIESWNVQHATAMPVVDHGRPVRNRPAGLYVDVAAILDGNIERVKPRWGSRADGARFIYPGKVNTFFGDPTSGKTLLVSAIVADALFEGAAVLWIDADHNGDADTIARFRSFGVPDTVLRDVDRFDMLTPSEPADFALSLIDAAIWRPDIVVIDSVGELLSLHGGSNDSADDFARINRATMSAFSDLGAAVIAIDHTVKSAGDSKTYGAGGTMAKKRAVNGLYARVRMLQTFSRRDGGKSEVTVVKDRPSAVLDVSSRDSEPRLMTFELIEREGKSTEWVMALPLGVDPIPSESPAETPYESPLTDAERILEVPMSRQPTSIRQTMKQFNWGGPRATKAFREAFPTRS